MVGIGVSVREAREDVEGAKCDCPSLLRRDFGAPRPIGCLTNLLSMVAEVGRSSKISSSVPSPKFRRRAGFVMVFLAARVNSGGATFRPVGPRPGVSGRCVRREKDLGTNAPPSLESPESCRRECRGVPLFILPCWD